MEVINGKFVEEELEQAIIDILSQNKRYTYLNGEKMYRDIKDILIESDLKAFIQKRYEDEHLTDGEMARLISNLENIPSVPIYDGNKQSYRMVTEGFNFVREDTSKPALYVNYIDFDNLDNNIYKIVNQYTVEDVKERRPDLLIFINGIPICICEFKTAIEEDKTIYDAWKQIHKRYKRDVPGLLKYTFISVISDGANTKIGSIFTPYSYYYSWNKANDEEKVSNGISSLFTMLKGALSPERITAILRDFIFFPDSTDKEECIVTRYPQFFAANRMFCNIREHMKPEGDGKGGTYFGATGCGKTYTMLFLSRLLMLRDNKKFKNPTIIIITDREDLDNQTSELFESAKVYLHEQDVKSIESRQDLLNTLKNKPSGGVYTTTIQKFCEGLGELSDRTNIICMSDEAHRTQVNIGPKLKNTKDGVETSYGFAKYLRTSFPNATYCGFTGTPIDETLMVFGDVVDSYTMKESSDDGITVRIQYEPRLARVILSDAQLDEIQKYYDKCIQDGANEEQVESSKRAMSKMSAILGNPDRLKKLAKDIVEHYEALCDEKPDIVQKAMVVCNDRKVAYEVLKNIVAIRPEWGKPLKTDKTDLSKDELDELIALPKINLVATRDKDDEQGLYDTCGTKEHRKKLDKQFKDINSNFKIAIVVDMWITGFDVPSLAVMYIDKPLRKHTLVQTISRVNRVFEGKEKGLVIDYIGIKNDMMNALKQYGDDSQSPVDELKLTLSIFRNHLAMIDDIMFDFDASDFYNGSPAERLNCLNEAVEFIQMLKSRQTEFMGLSRKLKAAYNICFPSGELTDIETAKAQFYMAIRSIIYKQTKGNTPDAETMNKVVEGMIEQAIACTGVENIVDDSKSIDLFSDEFADELSKVKMPISKFNALLKILRKAITEYGNVNKVKSIEFSERMKQVVEQYNSRDSLVFTNEVVSDFVNELSDELIKILNDLKSDMNSFEEMGISYEEKAFYDILIKVRDVHNFEYSDDKCIVLAKKIKDLVEDKVKFVDWSTRDDIKNQLNMELTVLLYNNGYPPEWNEEVFEKVMEQASNFKSNYSASNVADSANLEYSYKK